MARALQGCSVPFISQQHVGQWWGRHRGSPAHRGRAWPGAAATNAATATESPKTTARGTPNICSSLPAPPRGDARKWKGSWGPFRWLLQPLQRSIGCDSEVPRVMHIELGQVGAAFLVQRHTRGAFGSRLMTCCEFENRAER